LFDAYADERSDDERFYEWCRRVDNDRLRQIMQRADANVAGGVAHDEEGVSPMTGEGRDEARSNRVRPRNSERRTK